MMTRGKVTDAYNSCGICGRPYPKTKKHCPFCYPEAEYRKPAYGRKVA